ncbi:MAG: hypothetical protein ABW019_14980, partial [Chitinophagaceae bacterium]
MTRQQRIIVYSIVIFMMVWGLDLINVIKFRQSIDEAHVFHLLNFSQVLYALCTFLFVKAVSKRY